MRPIAIRSLQLFAFSLFVAVSVHAQSGVRFTATSENVSGAGEPIRINVTEWSPDSRRDEFVAAWTLATAAPQGRGAAAAGAVGGGAGGRGAAGGGGGRGGAGGGRGARGDAAAGAAATGDLPADPDAVDSNDPAFRFGRGGARGGPTGPAPDSPAVSLAAAIKKAPTVGILWTSEAIGYSIKYAYRLTQADGGERVILVTDRPVGRWSHLWKPAASVAASDYAFSIIELRVNPKGEGEGRGVMTGKVAVDTTARTIALDGYTALPVILKSVKRQSAN